MVTSSVEHNCKNLLNSVNDMAKGQAIELVRALSTHKVVAHLIIQLTLNFTFKEILNRKTRYT